MTIFRTNGSGDEVFILRGKNAEELWDRLIKGVECEGKISIPIIARLARCGVIKTCEGDKKYPRLDETKLSGIEFSRQKLTDLIPEKVVLLTVTCNEVNENAGDIGISIICDKCFSPEC